jgi:hypothetical protein
MAKKNISTAKRKAKFRKNFRAYLGFTAFFLLLNIFSSTDTFWAIYPILGWGVGVAIEYSSLYGPLKDSHIEDDYEEFDLDQEQPTNRRRRAEPLERDIGRGYREEDLV